MKRLTLSCLLLATLAASGCTTGPHAFFRHDQQAVNEEYTREVMSEQGYGSTATGTTAGHGGGGMGAGSGR